MLCLTPTPSLPACYTPPLLGLCLFWSEYSPDSSSICQCFQSVSLGSKRFPPHTHTHNFRIEFSIFICLSHRFLLLSWCEREVRAEEREQEASRSWLGSAMIYVTKVPAVYFGLFGVYTMHLPPTILSTFLSLSNCGCHLFMVWDWTVG